MMMGNVNMNEHETRFPVKSDASLSSVQFALLIRGKFCKLGWCNQESSVRHFRNFTLVNWIAKMSESRGIFGKSDHSANQSANSSLQVLASHSSFIFSFTNYNANTSHSPFHKYLYFRLHIDLLLNVHLAVLPFLRRYAATRELLA